MRELEGALERAALTARGDRLNLDRALPAVRRAPEPEPAPDSSADEPIFTAAELLALERRNTQRALERTGWRVAGADGAAQLLGMPASTLSSRMKALGLARPHAPPSIAPSPGVGDHQTVRVVHLGAVA